MTRYRRYRAPRDDGSALIDPPQDKIPQSISEHQQQQQAATSRLQIGGVDVRRLATEARVELLRLAQVYTATYADLAPRNSGPIILSGHQPELFHAGVWFKNFVLASVAQRVGGVGVHLLIDSDLCRSASVRVLSGDSQSPRFESVAFDRTLPPVPYEQRQVSDPRMFESFASRVANAIHSWIKHPLIESLWPNTVAATESQQALGEVLSQPRHRLEVAWGIKNLEIPFSRVCDTTAFRRFAFALLLQSQQLRKAYNEALYAYRKAHNLRNSAQPLPDLADRDGWIESPFWIWSDTEPERRPVWARVSRGSVALSDGKRTVLQLDADLESSLQQLEEARQAGVKLRSRALITTLYCRLILSDLFIHGIGGAKYDQVTDDLCQRFFGALPPSHATATATLWLPFSRNTPPTRSTIELQQQLRELRYHPEKYVSAMSEFQEWIDLKRRWVLTTKTDYNAAERHRAIEQANLALQTGVTQQRATIVESLRVAEDLQRTNRVCNSREFAFCLFPEYDIMPRLAKLAHLPLQPGRVVS